MSSCVVGYGAFVARSRVTPSRAVELAGAGLGALVLQVDWQGSKLRRRSVQQLRDEQDACAAAGLAVWWWAWCVPGSRRPEQLRQRLAGLVAEVGAPAGFIVDAEVDGGWSSSRPDLRPLATAARDVGMPLVGLTSHGMVGRRWPVEAFDVGLPQLYRQDPIDAAWAKHCLDTWARAPNCWPVLGCADPMSDAAAMQADLAALGELKLPGALWWTARQLVGARLAAAVPDPASWRGNSSETPKSSIRTYDGPLEVLG